MVVTRLDCQNSVAALISSLQKRRGHRGDGLICSHGAVTAPLMSPCVPGLGSCAALVP